MVAQSSNAKIKVTRQFDGGIRQELEFSRGVSERELARIAEEMQRNPAIEYAVPETTQYAQQTNDPSYSQQWNLLQQGVGIRVAQAWRKSTGKAVVVAVLDTGIRDHADLAGHILGGVDLVADPDKSNDGDGRDSDPSDPGDWCPATGAYSSWHGTHVSGIIAAVTNNGIGVAGTARDAMILPVRVLGRCGGSNFDISDGIKWAVGVPIDGVKVNATPAQVVNLSLGSRGPCDKAYQEAIDIARQKGSTIVVAAGNSDIDSKEFVPANCDGVISVAATNKEGARAYFGRPSSGSNFGSGVTISAPGGETYLNQAAGILSTLNDGIYEPGNDSYEAYQGTSMAAPHVSGVAALLYQIDPQITPGEVGSVLRATSQPFPTVPSRQCDTATCGAGILDAEAAVEVAIQRAAARTAATLMQPRTTLSQRSASPEKSVPQTPPPGWDQRP